MQCAQNNNSFDLANVTLANATNNYYDRVDYPETFYWSLCTVLFLLFVCLCYSVRR